MKHPIQRNIQNNMIYTGRIIDGFHDILTKDEAILRLFFISNDFQIYTDEQIQCAIEEMLEPGKATEFWFIGKGAERIEKLSDITIVSSSIENGDDMVLSVLTVSDENLDDGIIYAFMSGQHNEVGVQNLVICENNELMDSFILKISHHE